MTEPEQPTRDERPNRIAARVYDELCEVAARVLARQSPGQSLQTNGLVHEAYLRMASANAGDFESRGHFLAVAARAMRQILVDHARRRRAEKRGADWNRVTISDVAEDGDARMLDVLDLEGALATLVGQSERAARVAELRFFAGLSVEEVADALEVSERTVKNDWRFARAWLRRELEREPGDA